MISMKRPSRGAVESATTIRYIGVFFRPSRRRRIRTAISTSLAMGDVVLSNGPQGSVSPPPGLIAPPESPGRTQSPHCCGHGTAFQNSHGLAVGATADH